MLPDRDAEPVGEASTTHRAELAEQLDQLAHSLRNERDLRLNAWPSPGVTVWQTMMDDVNAVMAQIDEVQRMVEIARDAGADTDGRTDSGAVDAAANVEAELGKARRSIRAALLALEIPARDADPETQSELHAKAIATLGGVANYCEALAIILRGESYLP